MKYLLPTVTFFIFVSPVFSATWNAGGFDNSASNPANWTGDFLPPYGDDMMFNNTSSIDCTWDLDGTYNSLTVDGSYTGTITFISTLNLSIPSDCGTDADCASGYFCSAPICVSKFSNGNPCTAASQCSSNYCADSVCCDSPCQGSCEVCSQALGALADGLCSAKPGCCASGMDCPLGQSCCVSSASCVTSCSTCIGANYDCSISKTCVSSCSTQCSSYSNCPLSNSCVLGCFSCGSYSHTCLISFESSCVPNCLHTTCPTPPGSCN